MPVVWEYLPLFELEDEAGSQIPLDTGEGLPNKRAKQSKRQFRG